MRTKQNKILLLESVFMKEKITIFDLAEGFYIEHSQSMQNTKSRSKNDLNDLNIKKIRENIGHE